ncbi:MAG: HEAT repeat domain-containing protein [Bacteroidota bacterium]
MMNNKDFELWAMAYLKGELSEEKVKEFEKWLYSDSRTKALFEDLRMAWEELDMENIPEPSKNMDVKFFDMLSKEIAKREERSRWPGMLWENIKGMFIPRLAYALILLGAGLGLGYFFKGEVTSVQVVETDSATKEVRQKLVLTLLDQPSANQRLEGVSEANKFVDANKRIVEALLQTLNADPNVNVRLAAIESLTNYVENPLVRQGLIQSIPYQESPIVQVTLANLMLALQEKRSVEPFKRLLREKQLDTTVQKRIENTIASIL